MKQSPFRFYEFFAGGGMARLGFGEQWQCLLANDLDIKKIAAYKANWGQDSHLLEGDISALSVKDLPGRADVAWASFPCQDLSLAGAKAGLSGSRSGTFWSFWSLMLDLAAEGRSPPVIVLENVYGALTSRKGKDFAAIADAVVSAGYKVSAQVMDASSFVPQSRVRLFVVAVRDDLELPPGLLASSGVSQIWYPEAVCRAFNSLQKETATQWVWWNIPLPGPRKITLESLIDREPDTSAWHSEKQTSRLLSLMSDVNLAKVDAAKAMGVRQVGTIYRRTRQGVQRAEVRFDGVAGCLRTPTGGSSRQTIIEVDGSRVRTRLISSREAARLMGLPETYSLPAKYNDAYHLLGDGLAVPVVSHLVKELIEPIIRLNAIGP